MGIDVDETNDLLDGDGAPGDAQRAEAVDVEFSVSDEDEHDYSTSESAADR